MKVYIPRYSGFCPGVKFAEKKLFERKRKGDKKISVLGELIHNRQYIDHLASEGIGSCASVDEFGAGTVAVIRTHGIEKGTEDKMREKLDVLDLTCGKVKQLQEVISKHSALGYTVVITGKKDHPEMLGLVSCAKSCVVIESEKDLEMFTGFGLKTSGIEKILVVSQTTGSRSLFERTTAAIEKAVGNKVVVKKVDSICSVNTLREQEASELQKNSEVTIVIGDRISSNANKLFDILKKSGEASGQPAFFVSNLADLLDQKVDLEKVKSALVVSSSSTPEFVEKELVNYLLEIGRK